VRRLPAAAGVVVAAGVAAALAVAAPAGATPVLGTSAAEVTIAQSGAAEVQIDYTISGAEGPTQSVSFSALAFSGNRVRDVEVTAGGTPLVIAEKTAGLKTTVTATLPAPLAPGSRLDLVVRYAVPEAAVVAGEDLDAAVPMLTLDNPPAATAPGVFAATVTLPPGYSYVRGFPATPSSVDGNRIRYEVPASTSVVRAVATTGAVPFFTLERVIELLLLLVIIGSAAACLAYFVYSAKRRRLVPASPEGSR
jgi:hypothetical protein